MLTFPNKFLNRYIHNIFHNQLLISFYLLFMCVDDYQFRHYSAIRSKECRRFIFINEDQIQKAFNVNISQFQEEGEVALCKIILHLSTRGLPIIDRQFYWSKFNVSVKPGDLCKVPFWTLDDKEITFESSLIEKNEMGTDASQSFSVFKCLDAGQGQKKQETDEGSLGISNCGLCDLDQIKEEDHSQSKISQNSCNNEFHTNRKQSISVVKYHSKRTREVERSILEVIVALKTWRKLYESKKLNLTKAAKVVGISKKSLDDYYLIIRMGEFLGFDFSSHIYNKMGELRYFLKNFQYKVSGKLTKNVKCFKLVPDIDINQILESFKQSSQLTLSLIEDD